MLKKILETQMLRYEHFPVVVFFNAITDDSFVNIVQHLSTGVGYGINDVDCTFPNDLEPGEEPFHGVLFALHDDKVIVDYQTFYYYLEQASNTYITEYPQDKKTISEVLRKVFEKYRLAN
ncbi:ribonuclease toxin immunity protein CdiI [Bacillus safensis]|uniref:ribonuclease toxin immunity protein CdiI n=1 Tax=Bacillus safensis TaxID=561879 RepID=UPI001F4E1928|nr:ribonuclease toxin immunity protein CdiI [Bacillus safensis]